MALQGEAAAIHHQLGAFIDTHLDVAFDPRLVGSGDDRAVIGLRISADADPELADRREQFGAQRVGGVLTHRHHHRKRHAAFAG